MVAAAGTSMANHLAMAALIDPGDEVLIEQPTYELLTSTLLYLGATVKHFTRSEESGYALDPAEVRRGDHSQHQIHCAHQSSQSQQCLGCGNGIARDGRSARSVGAHVLVDEVYLDAVYINTPKPSFHLGPEFVATTSLTKVYGLSGLRCGWILAEPDLARAMWRLNDLFASIPAHPAELLSVVALQNLDTIRERSRKIVEADRALLLEFLAGEEAVSAPRTEFGTTAILRLESGSIDDFIVRLRVEFEASAVPGKFFGLPNHFRIGMGVDHEMFREGLQRIAQALKG